MKFIIWKYYSGFCTYEIEADNEDEAREKVKELPIDYDEVISTLEPWKDADEIK
jgi:hypothetical protein